MPQALDFEFSVDGDVQIKRRLEGILAHTEDLTPAFKRIVASFRRHEAAVFRTQGGATKGGGWAPLSEDYRAWKSRHYPGAGILKLTGKLEAALTQAGAAGAVEQIEPQSLTMGSDVRTPGGRWNLGKLHQDGTTKGLPARRIIDIPQQLASAWMRYLREHMLGAR